MTLALPATNRPLVAQEALLESAVRLARARGADGLALAIEVIAPTHRGDVCVLCVQRRFFDDEAYVKFF